MNASRKSLPGAVAESRAGAKDETNGLHGEMPHGWAEHERIQDPDSPRRLRGRRPRGGFKPIVVFCSATNSLDAIPRNQSAKAPKHTLRE